MYSWVPEPVQDAILRVCARNLAPNGVAYVSYNTYPGWHIRGMVRDMILFHDRPGLGPTERVARGREFAKFVAKAVPKSDAIYAAVLENELETLGDASDSYFLHEELETINSPVYFTEFARRARDAGLRYVAEALPSTWTVQLDGASRRTLREWARDDIEYEQYLDFVRNRTFRRSVLCHASHATESLPAAEFVPRMYVASRSVPDPSSKDANPAKGIEVFRTPEGVAVAMDNVLVRAALHVLHEARPSAIPFSMLVERTAHRAASLRQGVPLSDVELAQLSDAVMRSALVRLVELRTASVPCATSLSATPEGSAVARLQARGGKRVTSARHHSVELAPFDRMVLRFADGTRDVRRLADSMERAIADGELVLGDGVIPPRSEIEAAVGSALRQLLNASLLVA